MLEDIPDDELCPHHREDRLIAERQADLEAGWIALRAQVTGCVPFSPRPRPRSTSAADQESR